VLEVSGLVAGLLVGGFGSRLMMRIMAATSGLVAQGKVTEAEEVVGRVTSGGTIGLLIFVGIFGGVIGAAVFALVGRFLPRRAWAAGLVLALLLLGVARRDPLDPSNKDFAILSPVLLAVVLIVALFLLYGMTVVALAGRLERSYPVPGWNARALLAYAPMLFLVFPPLPLAVVAAVGMGALGARFPSLGEAWRSRVARLIGRTAVAAAAVAGNVWLAFGVAEILS
jgi:hypothetical protein